MKKKRKTFLQQKRYILTTILCIILSLSFTACGQKATGINIQDENKITTVTIGYLPITHAQVIFETKEILEKQAGNIQIKLQKFSSWTDLMDALNTGRIDGASVLIELAMGAVSQGVDLKAVALGHKDGNVIVVSDEVQSVEDLRGKTFAIPLNQSSHNILLRDMLEKADIGIDEITVTQLAPTEMPSGLANGSIDGYCVAEPFGAQAVVQGYGHVLYDSKEIWDNSVCCAFVLNNAFIKNNPDPADTIADTYFAAGNSLSENPDRAKEIAAKYLGQDEEILATSLKWIQYHDLTITQEDYDLLAAKMKKYEINSAPPAYEEFVYQRK